MKCIVKPLVTFCLLLLLSFSAHAQQEAYNWYFGDHAGITFKSGSPVALTDGQMYAGEGCSSMSDKDGNLLFYTNGQVVFNKDHQVMDNGNGLWGSGLSTQSSLNVKLPGSDHIYYVFTVPDDGVSTGYRFSIIDMTMNNGKGKVTSLNNAILKNFSDPSSEFNDPTEALTAVYHSNNADIWIILHERGVARFYSYLLTSAGLSAPVISNSGTLQHHLSQCRVSPDGKKLALGGYFGAGLELYDFDNTTGKIHNSLAVIPAGTRIYGVSFSPDSRLLYATTDGADIYQFDVSLASPLDIPSSSYRVGSGSGGYYPQMQLGPDAKLYMAHDSRGYLGCINNPNVKGAGCSYVDNAVSLGGKRSELGLPTFMVNYVTPKAPNIELGSDQVLCGSQSVMLDAGAFTNATYQWSTGETSQKISVNSAGKYVVDVTVNGVKASDTITITYVKVDELNTDKVLCEGDTLTIAGDNHSITYLWSDSTSGLPHKISKPGSYWVERTQFNCTVRDEFRIAHCPLFIPNLITPNADGMNDVFHVKNLPDGAYHFEVYNRWGSLIFAKEKFANPWQPGTVPDGTYYFRLKENEGTKEYSGWLHILSSEN